MVSSRNRKVKNFNRILKYWIKCNFVFRVANVAKMMVYSESTKSNPQLYYSVTSPASTIFDVGPTDKLWIGQNRSDDIFVTNVGLAGCLHDVTLDGKPIGLWNFVSSSPSCTACNIE